MFSGLVREIASVKSFEGSILRLVCKHRPEIGDSIAVNGMCLTVIALYEDGFSLEVSEHSRKSVAIENYTNLVHIEPALRADSRLDGHFVQGHIDAIGVIKKIIPNANQTYFEIQAQKSALMLIIPKGSVTVDGISLTISDVNTQHFCLTIIPHTFQSTLFHTYRVGRRVNIETDMLVRSIAHILAQRDKFSATPTWQDLDEIVLQY